MIIRHFELEDLEKLIEYNCKHMSESGIKGNPVYAPFPSDHVHDKEKMREQIKASYSAPINQVGWRRTFLLEDHDQVYGSLSLSALPLCTSLHRCLLGIGLDSEVRGKGYGKKLMEYAICWARETEQIQYIDLGVFSHNRVAIQLYKGLGFKEIGRIEDLFRINGDIITDIQMTLRL
jgi:RimJ/RimL family protein N-acetyltransferase